ncbi:MAG: CinA family protein [Pseudomonadales bacterium]|nr:CinA family protein [Pseudomonadales bacterium]
MPENGLLNKRTEFLEKIRDQALLRGWRMVTAESCTGGGVAKALTELEGSSLWFECGLVTYSNEMKQTLLLVQPSTLESYGAVSEQTVEEMASGALIQSGVELAVAISGIAGPGGGSEEKPVGTVWFAWAVAGRQVESACHLFKGNRISVREQAINIALEGLLHRLEST